MSSPAQPSSSSLRTLALILLPILGIVLVGAVIYATQSKEKAIVTVVVGDGQTGGAAAPETCCGNSAKWKYAQKKATKNITSEAMNSVMP